MKDNFIQLVKSKWLLIAAYFVLLFCSAVILPADRIPSYLFYGTVLTLALALMTLSELTDQKKTGTVLFWLGMFVLASVMAFRDQTGIDDRVYARMFAKAGELNLFEYTRAYGMEIGFETLHWCLYYLTGGNYDIAQIITTLGTFLIFGLAIRSFKGFGSYAAFAFVLWTHYYYLIMGGGLVRIFLAIAICFYALHYMLESRWLAYTVCVLAASLIHMSALVMLILLVAAINEKWCYKYWMVLVAGLAVMMPVAFIAIGKLLAPLLGERYAQYTEIGTFSFSVMSFDALPVWAVGVYYCYKYSTGEERRKYVIGLVLVSMSIIFSVFSSLVPLGRLSFYGNLGILIIISGVCRQKPSGKLARLEMLVPYGLVAYEALYMLYTGPLNPARIPRIFPYISVFGSV